MINHNRGVMAYRTTTFLSVSDIAEMVRRVGLSRYFDLVISRIEGDFRRWHDFEKSPRTANHSEIGVIELMPVSDDTFFSFKYVNGHPENPKLGLSTVMAFGALSEVTTGWPLLLSEMTILTAIRTASTSVFAAKLLARPDSSSMAMIGNGAQSEFQILAFQQIMGINRVHLFDTDTAATQKLIHNLGQVEGLELVQFKSVDEAVVGCDIVTTCTADKTNATILTLAMVEPGMHLNAIGGDCPGKTELSREVVQASNVFVEFTPQSRVEGEIQQMEPDFEVTELWQVVEGFKPGRISATEVTLFDSVGFALEDFSALCVTLELAKETGIGSEIELVPAMEDVKNLFSFVRPGSALASKVAVTSK